MANEWIEWGGGECPVDRGVMVDVFYRDGIQISELPAAECYGDGRRDASIAFWRSQGYPNDIIAYRLHQPEEVKAAPNDDGGWIKCSDRMPPPQTGVLVATRWGREWVMKWATYCAGHPDASAEGWIIPGASWVPTHWQPLPAPPKGE